MKMNLDVTYVIEQFIQFVSKKSKLCRTFGLISNTSKFIIYSCSIHNQKEKTFYFKTRISMHVRFCVHFISNFSFIRDFKVGKSLKAQLILNPDKI